jgi:hypothetical protein
MLLAIAGVGVAIYKNKELPESMSAVVYDLPKRQQWLWTLWMWAIAVAVGIPLIDRMGGSMFQFLAFFTMVSMVFCGAIPIVRKERNTVHYGLAIVAGVTSQLCVVLIEPLWLFVLPVALSFVAVAAFMKKPWTEWVWQRISGKGVMLLEAVCAMSLFGCLLFS